MSVIGEILATWRNPAGPVGRLLATGPREDRSLAILMGACLMMFLARLPDQARQSAMGSDVPREAGFGIIFFVMLFVVPLIAYALAGVSHLVLRTAGRTGPASGARVALFWALFAAGPAILVQGLISGLAGPDATLARLAGIAVFAAFLWFWGRGLSLAYAGRRAP